MPLNPPDPFEHKKLHQRLIKFWADSQSLRAVSNKDLTRLPWVLFDPISDTRTGKHTTLAQDSRLVANYVHWLNRTPRSRAIRALLHEFLRHYPHTLKTFHSIRQLLIRHINSGNRHPSIHRWHERCQKAHLLETEGDFRLVYTLVTTQAPPSEELRDIGFDTSLANAAILESGITKYLDDVSTQLQRQRFTVDHLKRLLYLMQQDGTLRFPNLRVDTAEKLLAPFTDNTSPASPIRHTLHNFFLAQFGHPRLPSGRAGWYKIRPELQDLITRWTVDKSLEDFFKIVEETAYNDHWTYRKAFWKAYIQRGIVIDAWFALGRRANRVSSLFTDSLEHATLSQANLDHSVLLMQTKDLTVVEWSHSGACRIWFTGSDNAPKLYKKTYSGRNLRSPADFEQVHFGNHRGSWQDRIVTWIASKTGTVISAEDYMPRTRNYGGQSRSRR